MRRTALTTVLLALVFAPLARGQVGEPSVEDIVKKANHMAYYQGGTGRANVSMTIFNAKGDKVGERELVILRRNESVDEEKKDSLDQKLYAYFLKPADVRGTAYLVEKKTAEGEDDLRKLYTPAIDLITEIAPGEKRTSFVGTHFFYEDVSGRRITDDKHELINKTDDYYVVRSTPKKPGSVEFAYFDTYIHRTTFMPLYTFYYDAEGTKYREYKVLAMKPNGEYWTVTKAQMNDLREKGEKTAHTVAEYTNVEYEIDLPDDIFTERYMRKPPRDYLQ